MADDKNRKGKVMNEQEKFEKRKKITKYVLITISVLFVFFMLVMPLFCIVSSSLKQGQPSSYKIDCTTRSEADIIINTSTRNLDKNFTITSLLYLFF